MIFSKAAISTGRSSPYPDCEILDVCGPFEAFHFADLALGLLGRTKEPSYQSLVLAAAPGPIRTMSGMEIVATHRYSEIADGLDTLVVVGGIGCEEASKDPALVEWVRSIAPKTRRVASVCSGAFILAAAGLLHHRRATTTGCTPSAWRRHTRRSKWTPVSSSFAMGISTRPAGSRQGLISP